MKIVENTEIVTKMREKFLAMDIEGKQPIDATQVGKKNIIYMIVNLITGKRYIGKTTYLLDRANRYIYTYRNVPNDHRPLALDMRKYGIENFRMIPIAICPTRKDLAEAEYKYIIQYDTLQPNGYNVTLPSGTRYSTKAAVGHPHTVATKMMKSKLIAAINPDTKQLFIVTGMKLFGDYIGKSKDIIKNAAKHCNRICGYYIIYLNESDRSTLENKIREARAAAENRKGQRGLLKSNFDLYLSLVEDVKTMLLDDNESIFSDNGYACEFMIYNQESESPSYEFQSISSFFEMLENE